jgi:hypothetical protein
MPALRRRLRAVGHGCLDGLLSPPSGGWARSGKAAPVDAAAAAGASSDGAVVLVGDAVPWMVAGGGGGGTPHSPSDCPPLDVAYVSFPSPTAAARSAAVGLLAAVARWRARHGAPWPGVAEGEGEEEDAIGDDEAGQPVASITTNGCLTLRLPEREAPAVIVRTLPVGVGGPSSPSPSSPLLALERLLLQGGGAGAGFDRCPSLIVGCSPSPAMAFDGEQVWALPRSADALREGGLVLEARAGGSGGNDDASSSWAERRAAELRRAAKRGWQARVPVPTADEEDECAREAAQALDAACVAAEAAAVAEEAPPSPLSRSWPYRDFVRAGPHGATVLPEGLLDALVESWEAVARRPQPRGPYELVAFEAGR